MDLAGLVYLLKNTSMNESSQMKLKSNERNLDGQDLRLRIVASKYNRAIVDSMLKKALETLDEHGVKDENIEVVRVPGAFEIPLLLEQVKIGVWDAQIALGCLIRGETLHFDQVLNQCSRGVMNAMIRLGIPITFGVLATDNIEQACARAGDNLNRGEEYAVATIETANILKDIKSHE